jgi:hypothetical protein
LPRSPEKLLTSFTLLALAEHLDLDSITIKEAHSVSVLDEQTKILKATFESALASRKETRKQLHRQFTAVFKIKALDKHQKNLKAIDMKSKATHTHGALLGDIRQSHSIAVASSLELVGHHGANVEQAIKCLDLVEPDEEEIEGVDSEVIISEDPLQPSKSWDIFRDNDVVAIKADSAEVPDLSGAAGRVQFINDFIRHVSSQSTALAGTAR